MKKWCALLLAFLLAFTQVLAFAEDIVIDDGEEEVEGPRIPEGAVIYDHLSVANPTPMRGEFFTDLWGNATSDADVRMLLHDYNLVYWNGEVGAFTANPTVVADLAAYETEAGDHEYEIVLHEDLFYSDGSPVTASDYAFSLLLQIAPEIGEIGGTPLRKEHLLGFEEYLNGDVQYLAGVRVLDTNMLSITIRHEFLPFFYEMGLLMCNPYPISVIAPGVTVRDDGDGVYLEGNMTADLLRRTILDPQTGYMSHPSVVSGAYTLTSWDGETAEFTMNPYYKGNPDGILPVIEKLTYKCLPNDEMVANLEAGEVGLLNKIMRKDIIQQALDSLSGGTEIAFSNYPRVGLSYISFSCERATVASEAVRQAIAWCVDRDEVMRDYTGDYGIRVDGYYGIGQWMYGAVMGTIEAPMEEPEGADAKAKAEYEAAVKAWEELSFDNLTVYTLDTEAAIALLEKDGWVLNADGVREKVIDGQKVVLDLKMIYPEGNNINEVFEERLVPNLESVGIRLSMEAVPMQELLTRWYKQGERDEDMIYLASNFDIVFDPSVHFIVDETGEPNWAYTNLNDEQLYQLAFDMRSTEPGEVLEYVQKWLLFQERFNEILPMLPFYSNVYFDFYTEDLHDYLIASNMTWSEAIVEAALYEAPEVEEPAEEGDAEEGDMIID